MDVDIARNSSPWEVLRKRTAEGRSQHSAPEPESTKHLAPSCAVTCVWDLLSDACVLSPSPRPVPISSAPPGMGWQQHLCFGLKQG